MQLTERFKGNCSLTYFIKHFIPILRYSMVYTSGVYASSMVPQVTNYFPGVMDKKIG